MQKYRGDGSRIDRSAVKDEPAVPRVLADDEVPPPIPGEQRLLIRMAPPGPEGMCLVQVHGDVVERLDLATFFQMMTAAQLNFLQRMAQPGALHRHQAQKPRAASAEEALALKRSISVGGLD